MVHGYSVELYKPCFYSNPSLSGCINLSERGNLKEEKLQVQGCSKCWGIYPALIPIWLTKDLKQYQMFTFVGDQSHRNLSDLGQQMALTATSPHQQSNSAAVLAGSCQPRPLILLAKCPEFRQNRWRKCNWDCVLPAAQNTAGYVFIWKPLSAKLASCTPRRGQPPLMDRLLVQLRKLLSGLQYPVLAFCPKSVVQISGLA